jgi:serine/threonine-protein kinase
MLGDYGEVYVLDWGIARVLDDTQDISSDGGGSGGEDSDAQTAANTRIGTYGYMAPEQVRDARSVDHRADIYSLGCVLFEILAGESLHPRGPLALDTTLAGMDARPSTRGIDAPPELEALCVAATALDRARRLASARELATGVQRFLDGDRDLARRRELALVHLEAARTAFASGDTARSSAMREAGRALALDPSLTAAAELVARLMLEPPKTTPPEVAREIERLDEESARRNGRIGGLAYTAFLLFLPLLFGGRFTPLAIVLIACVAANTVPLLMGMKGRYVAIINIVLVAVLARMFSPFYIAPGIAAVITLALVFNPTYKSRGATAALIAGMLSAVFVPWLAEHLGYLSTTMVLDTGQVSFYAREVKLGPTQGLVGQIGYITLLITAAALIGRAMWITQRSLRHALHLQTWQLGQLVEPPSR